MSAVDAARRRWLALATATMAPRAWGLMAGEPPDAPSRRVDPIDARSPWTSVVAITRDDATGIWSGVGIAPRCVLTAGHVAAGAAPETLRVHANVARADDGVIRVRTATLHPFFHGATPGSSNVDLALLMLEAPLPAMTRFVPVDDAHRPAGSTIALVGYGASGFGAVGVSVGAKTHVRRVGANVVDRVEVGGVQARPWIYLFTFDPPNSPRAVPGETGLASGDSGSPAFVRDANGWRLYGINTFILQSPGARASVFGTVCGGQLIAPHVEWLRAECARAGG